MSTEHPRATHARRRRAFRSIQSSAGWAPCRRLPGPPGSWPAVTGAAAKSTTHRSLCLELDRAGTASPGGHIRSPACRAGSVSSTAPNPTTSAAWGSTPSATTVLDLQRPEPGGHRATPGRERSPTAVGSAHHGLDQRGPARVRRDAVAERRLRLRATAPRRAAESDGPADRGHPDPSAERILHEASCRRRQARPPRAHLRRSRVYDMDRSENPQSQPFGPRAGSGC
jgi:hypothetical protein